MIFLSKKSLNPRERETLFSLPFHLRKSIPVGSGSHYAWGEYRKGTEETVYTEEDEVKANMINFIHQRLTYPKVTTSMGPFGVFKFTQPRSDYRKLS